MEHRNVCVGKEVLLLCQDLFIKLSKQSSQNTSENSVFGLIFIFKCFRFQPGCAMQFAAIKAFTAQVKIVLHADKTDIPFISMAHQRFQIVFLLWRHKIHSRELGVIGMLFTYWILTYSVPGSPGD